MGILKRLAALCAALLLVFTLAGCGNTAANLSGVPAPGSLRAASRQPAAAEDERAAIGEEIDLLEYNCKRLALYAEHSDWEGAARFLRQTDRQWRILRYRRGADYPQEALNDLRDSIRRQDDVSSFQQALDLLKRIYDMELALGRQ